MTPAGSWTCLMYHDVTEEPLGLTGGGAYFSVSLRGFRRQLEVIRDLGKRGCSVEEALAGGDSNRVAISFDDVDLGQATRAFPALVDARMTATFFVVTSWIGRPKYASWDQVREMRAGGMSIQCHTHTHPFLSELSADALRDELRRSSDILGEQLGERPTTLALPGGDAPRADLRAIIAEEGYTTVATSRWGRNPGIIRGTPRYVRRCTVRGEPGDEAFAAIVRGDRWLALKRAAREGTLAFVRSSLGPTRYARWRRTLFNAGAKLTSVPGRQ